MRKLLLASAAILGATGGLAMAQAPSPPSQGQLVTPYARGPAVTTNNSGWGIANTPSGSPAAGGLSGYGSLGPNFYAVPKPGTVQIRLGGRVEADVTAGFTPNNSQGGTKVSPVQIGSYMRLYPGFDGMSTNGIRYGAQIELRENFPAQVASPSLNSSGETVFVRRSYVYLASDKAGLVRIGQGDGLVGLFDNCIFTSQCFDAGVGVTQGAMYATMPSNATGGAAVYPWVAQAGAEYDNNKIVYLSPQYFGFDFGLQYAPGMGNGFANSGPFAGCGTATDSCNAVTAGGVSNKWYNQTGFGLRYEHTFGAVDLKAFGFYELSGHEHLNGPYGKTVTTLRYDNLGFYQAGVAVTTQGLTAAVAYIGGRVNGQVGLDPTGAPAMNAIIGGLTYISGPLVLGANLGVIDSQGQADLVHVSQRHEVVSAIGGNYGLAPGLNLVLEYEYIQRHQGGFNFLTAADGPAGNTVHAQGVTFSTVLTW